MALYFLEEGSKHFILFHCGMSIFTRLKILSNVMYKMYRKSIALFNHIFHFFAKDTRALCFTETPSSFFCINKQGLSYW